MNLLTVIPVTSETTARAERLCDLIYWLSECNPKGHCLLAFENGVHDEFKEKTKIAAEVAFRSVDMHTLRPLGPHDSARNELAAFVSHAYRLPWILLEPDCVPIKKDWREQLLIAYQSQPKRYIGPHLLVGKPQTLILSRIAVYPPDAVHDIHGPLLPYSTKTRLIQELAYDGDMTKIRQDAVLLHGDKSGSLVEQLIEECSTKLIVEPKVEVPVLIAKRRPGRPTKIPRPL